MGAAPNSCMKSGQGSAPRHQGACQGEESWVSQGLVGVVFGFRMVTDGGEKEREIKKGKYHGKKREVLEMRTQECQIILFHLKFCLDLWYSQEPIQT